MTNTRPPETRRPVDDGGLPLPRRRWSVLAVRMAIGMAVLDGTIANVALPTIARELEASAAASVWIVNAYQLAIMVLLLPLAALGERIGYRRVYVAGLGFFTVGSLACALSPNLETLIASRVFQGLGAAAIMSISSALIRHSLPASLLGRGIGVNAVVIALAAAAGPTASSVILGLATWEWLFAINVPVGLVTIGISIRALPRTEGAQRPFDLIAALLNALAFGFLVLGAESLVAEGLAAGLAKIAIGLLAAAALVWREFNKPAPLVPLDLLRIPAFGVSSLASVFSFAAQMLAFVALPFYFQGPLARTAVQTGLLMTPWPLAVAVSAPVAGWLADRYPSGALAGLGMGVFAAGLGTLAVMGWNATDADIAWRMALCGIGFGFFQAPNNRAIIASAPISRSGAAGGMLSTSRLLGQTAGAVGMGMFFHVSGPEGAEAALGVAAIVAVVAALISFSKLGLERRSGPGTGRDPLES